MASDNISVIRFGACEAELMLREALAQCAEVRSRGKEPYVVVMMGEDEHLPTIGRTTMFGSDLTACAMRLQIEAQEHMRELYSEPVE